MTQSAVVTKIAEDLFEEALRDYIGLWQIVRRVVLAWPSDDVEFVRRTTLVIVQDLLHRRMLAGDLSRTDGFDPWVTQAPENVCSRIATAWDQLGRLPDIGDICWFDRQSTVDTGQKVLRLQCEGIEPTALWRSVESLSIVAFAMPARQTFRAAWLFQLIFNNGSLIEFSSACTQIVGWQEVGSLNIRYSDESSDGRRAVGLALLRTDLPPFQVIALEKLVFEDDDVITECGLSFYEASGEEIVVSAGIPPGSVTIAAPFSKACFEPQFSNSVCKRERL